MIWHLDWGPLPGMGRFLDLVFVRIYLSVLRGFFHADITDIEQQSISRPGQIGQP